MAEVSVPGWLLAGDSVVYQLGAGRRQHRVFLCSIRVRADCHGHSHITGLLTPPPPSWIDGIVAACLGQEQRRVLQHRCNPAPPER